MRDKLPDGKAIILVDEDGNRFVAEHHMGDSYTLTPIDKKKE